MSSRRTEVSFSPTRSTYIQSVVELLWSGEAEAESYPSTSRSDESGQQAETDRFRSSLGGVFYSSHGRPDVQFCTKIAQR